jgi:sec-independent protein translocase protein TatA
VGPTGILPVVYSSRADNEFPCNFASQPDVQSHTMSLLASFTNLLSGGDLLLILLVILLLFGAKKLPELARGMGQALREFQKAKDEFSDELHKASKTEETIVRPAQANVPRIESGTSAAQPDPNQTVTPGNRADQV